MNADQQGTTVTDDELMAMLRAALADDSAGTAEDVPASVVEAAHAAWSWRTIDDELARLAFDSADEPALAGLRAGRPPSRQLTFEQAGVRLELEVTTDGVLGQIRPGQPVHVRLDTPDRPAQELASDDQGRFVVHPTPSGPVRLRCGRPDGAFLVTGWVLL